MNNLEFYQACVLYLKQVYCLEPNDIDLSENSVSNRGEDETPQQYIDYYAQKYSLENFVKIFFQN